MMVTNPFSDLRSWTRAEVERVSKGWWVLLVTGLISVVAGGVIIINNWTVSDLAIFLGVVLVCRGFVTLFSVPIDVAGLLEIGVGIGVWVWPGPTLLVIAYFIGWWLLFRGVVTIAGSIAARDVMPYWGWALALGIGEVLVSFYLLSRPGVTLVATVLAIGLVAMFYGVVEVALAFEVKNLPRRFDDITLGHDGSHGSRQRHLEGANR